MIVKIVRLIHLCNNIRLSQYFKMTHTISAFLAKIIAPLTLKSAEKTDNRLRLMNQVITGLQVIKMYVWEIPFSNLVEKARK